MEKETMWRTPYKSNKVTQMSDINIKCILCFKLYMYRCQTLEQPPDPPELCSACEHYLNHRSRSEPIIEDFSLEKCPNCGIVYYLIPNLDIFSRRSKYTKKILEAAISLRENFSHLHKCECVSLNPDSVPLLYGTKSKNAIDFMEAYLSKIRSIRIAKNRISVGKCVDSQFEAIMVLQKYSCYFCLTDLTESCKNEEKNHHWDHLEPLVRGGTNWPINMALTCKKCNLQKGAKTEAQFWLVIKKIHGSEFVKMAKEVNASYRKQKNKI